MDLTLQDVLVTSDQLKHVRDTLVRADSALKRAKTSMLLMAEDIHNQQGVVREAIVMVDAMASTRGQ